jgi:hypothetical protein
MQRIDSNADFFGREPVVNLLRYCGQRRDPGRFEMAFGPLVSRLSVVTAYLAFALVGAIVLGVF